MKALWGCLASLSRWLLLSDKIVRVTNCCMLSGVGKVRAQRVSLSSVLGPRVPALNRSIDDHLSQFAVRCSSLCDNSGRAKHKPRGCNSHFTRYSSIWQQCFLNFLFSRSVAHFFSRLSFFRFILSVAMVFREFSGCHQTFKLSPRLLQRCSNLEHGIVLLLYRPCTDSAWGAQRYVRFVMEPVAAHVRWGIRISS